jgi:hypothetical protein
MPLHTKPCRYCGVANLIPIDPRPIRCKSCREITPLRWFTGSDALGQFRAWALNEEGLIAPRAEVAAFYAAAAAAKGKR